MMQNSNRKYSVISLLVVLFFLAGTMAAFAAQEAVLKEASGKVELRAPGRGWQPARVGMALTKGTTISTGFGAKAVLDLGASVVEVKALTRMTLEELLEQEGTIKTELFLDVGRVKAQIQTGEDLRHDFKLKSTVSTASVRGTTLEGDGEVWVSEDGSFVVSNNVGQSTTVSTGESTTVNEGEPPASPQDVAENETNVETSTNPSEGGGGDIAPPTIFIPELPDLPTTTTVTITWE
jgi:hypothetical protein